MKRALMAMVALVLVSSVCFAAQGDAQKAVQPVTDTIEATGKVVGELVDVTVGAGKQAGESSIAIGEETGKVVVLPLDPAAKIVDTTFNVLTLNQLKKGDKVTVEYAKDEGGVAKAKTVEVTK